MLFTYDATANVNNWLHDRIYFSILEAVNSLDAGNAPVLWPEILTDPEKVLLSNRTAVKKRYNKFIVELRKLDAVQRSRVRNAVVTSNDIPGILLASNPCEKIETLPEVFRTAVSNLFETLFNLLNDLEIRAEQYKIIYEKIDVDVCPFCGLEMLPKPGGPKHDWDHYMPKSFYPFAGANLKNLVPMGVFCNQRIKGSKDILFDGAGARRLCFDPFGFEVAGVHIDGVELHEYEGIDEISWLVSCISNDPAYANTWNQIWHVSDQYAGVIKKRFKTSWLTQFVKLSCRQGPPSTREEVLLALEYMIDYCEAEQHSGAAFLKKAVFEWIKGQVELEQTEADRYSDLLIRTCHDYSTQTLD